MQSILPYLTVRLACLFGSLRSSVSAQKVLCRNRSTCWWTSDVFVAGSSGGGSLPILLLHHLESLLWDIMTQTWAFESWSPCCLVQHATICCFDGQRRPVWETASYPCSFPWRCGVALEVVCERHLEEFASPTAFEFPVLFISELGFMTSFFFFNWSILDLPWYVNFRCTAKRFSDTYLYVVFFFSDSFTF